jgi:hypothetical protein
MGAHDPVITYYQAARIHAQAWYEDPTANGKGGGFRDSLDKDPFGALKSHTGVITRRDYFGIQTQAKLIALELYNDDLGDIDFNDYDQAELTKIFTTGLDNNLNQVSMQPSLWITPSGKITEVGRRVVGISLENWARIYAYIWFQFRNQPPNATIKGHFEIDPARALHDPAIANAWTDEIITSINNLSSANNQIPYQHGQTPLITHGAPPTQDPGEPSFHAISDDPNAKGYRYIIRFSC